MSERPVMDAIHIRMTAGEIESEQWDADDLCCIWVKTTAFSKAVGGPTPGSGGRARTAATQGNRFRFRVAVTVAGSPELAGVYFVGGWTDNGLVFLDRDEVQDFAIPRRREAVLATRAKHAAKVKRRVHGQNS